MQCANGHPMRPGEQFCQACGSPPAAAATSSGPTAAISSNIWWIAGTIIAAAAAVVIVLLLNRGDGSSSTTTTVAQTTVTGPGTSVTQTTSPPGTATSAPTATTQPATGTTLPSGTTEFSPWTPVTGGDFAGPGGQQIFDIIPLNGGRFIAVGQSDGTATAWGLNDASQWVRAGSAPPPAGYQESQFLEAAVRPDGSILAVGRIYDGTNWTVTSWTSPMGATWTGGSPGLAPGPRMVTELVSHSEGFTAVGYAITGGQIDAAWWTSADGTAWTEAALTEPGDQAMFGAEVTGDRIVAVGITQPDEDGTFVAGPGAEDPAVWSAPVTTSAFTRSDAAGMGGPDLELAWDITSGGSGLVAVGRSQVPGELADAAVWTSPDGDTWTRRGAANADLGGPGHEVMDVVTKAGSVIVAAGRTGPNGDPDFAAWQSSDGLAWTRVEDLTAPDWQVVNGLAWDGVVLAAAGATGIQGDFDAAVWQSAPGTVADAGPAPAGGGTWDHTSPATVGGDYVGVLHAATDGMLWAGGNWGLSSFDGAGWTVIPPGPPGEVTALAETPDGTLWLAAQFDGIWSTRTGAWAIEGEGFDLRGLGATADTVVAGDFAGATVWWDGASWSGFPPDPALDGLLALAGSPGGDLWAATISGPRRWYGTGWSEPDGVPDAVAGASVNAITIAGDGTIWFGFEDGGIAEFDGAIWTVHGAAGGLPADEIRDLAVDGGSLWAASPEGWIAWFDGSGWSIFEHPDRPTFISITASGGTVWTGTVSDGLYRFTP